MSDTTDTPVIRTGEEKSSADEDRDPSCCYVVDPCGCYVDPCCCTPVCCC